MNATLRAIEQLTRIARSDGCDDAVTVEFADGVITISTGNYNYDDYEIDVYVTVRHSILDDDALTVIDNLIGERERLRGEEHALYETARRWLAVSHQRDELRRRARRAESVWERAGKPTSGSTKTAVTDARSALRRYSKEHRNELDEQKMNSAARAAVVKQQSAVSKEIRQLAHQLYARHLA
jgi:hypothetical protein